ncbi:OmpA family protein [Microbulbifer yueqingensis]|uniref:Outer membrane protein OmpA n=1 Tax=Microbulbifer yueqingensis TaxID=658219 RepID=A0A1G9CTU0_9GAMM|nr:OmpA family protein [Microbulbifer yueqingensis]SDK55068.1 Outer membrane protein OmpA [Microbulbifer yueqingensis]
MTRVTCGPLFVLVATVCLAACYDDPNRKYALEPLPNVQAGAAEQLARESNPFGDEMVRYLRGKPREDGNEFTLGVRFEPGGFAPRMDTLADLEALLVIMRDYPSLRIAIEGHTDNEGEPDKNRRLSQARADWVRQFLVERGVAAERVTSEGFGDTRPIADNTSPAGQKKNRRLVIRILNFDSRPVPVEFHQQPGDGR